MLANDDGDSSLSIVSLTQPTVGSAEVLGDQIVVSLPPSYAGSVSFTYLVMDDSGQESTATVEVFSVNVLAPVDELVTDTLPAGDSFTAIAERAEVLIGGLLRIELNSLQVTVLALAPVLLGGMFFLLRRREILFSVTTTEATGEVGAMTLSGKSYPVRHDAFVWGRHRLRRRNGRSERLVEDASGKRVWIANDKLINTNF